MGKDFDLEKLKGNSNFHTWVFAMENYIGYKGYQNCIETIRDDKGAEVVKEKDPAKLAACKGLLVLSVEKNIFTHIKSCKTPLEIWKTLSNMYEDKGLSRKIGILKKLISTRLEDSESMQSYIDTIMDESSKLQGIGFNISDEWLGAILLAGLTEKFRPLIMALEATSEEMRADLIISKLLDAQTDSEKEGSGFFTKGQKKPGKFGKPGEPKKNNNLGKGSEEQKRKCYNCGRTNHLIKDCRALKKDTKVGQDSSGTANSAFTAMACRAMPENKSREWYIDSGGSNHMTFDANFVLNKGSAEVREIFCANGQTMKVNSVGNGILKTENGNIPVEKVYHVPELGVNLLSVNKIVEKGNTILFDKSGCTIRNSEGNTVMHTKAENGVYKIQEVIDKSLVTTTVDDVMTWHRRLGHLNSNSMNQMRRGVVDGVNFSGDESEIRNCATCCFGKMSRLPFPTSETKASKILELIHSDLDGPMETQSIGHAKYFLTFIDDFSRNVFVYFLKCKSEVLEKFKHFKSFVENQTGERIQSFVSGITKPENISVKKLRSDRGGEYCSAEFERYLASQGIQHQLTAPYTPQQNGVAERLNRTLVEKAKCLLFDADLPKHFWAEAIHMAAFLYNNSVNSSGKTTPHQLYTGKKSDLTNLKVFGTEVMVHVPDKMRRKWDQKSEKMVFVGYDDNTKGYRCIDKKTGKLRVSRDVKFLDKSEKVILNLDDDATEHFEGKINIGTSEPTQDESVIIVDDSIYEETETSSSNDESSYENLDDSNDPDYEPSDETIKEAEEDESKDHSPHKNGKQRKVNPSPLNLTNYAFFVEPQTLKAATSDDDADKWIQAINEEMHSHKLNGTWTLTNLPEGKKAIKSKWVFKIKRNQMGEISRYKARLVVKGCSQKPGIDYTETFAPVVRYSSLRFLFALAVKYRLNCYQLDAITAFIQGEVTEELYMEQPEGFNDGTKRVCKLNRALYGLKQAGRLWNLKLDSALSKFGLQKCKSDPCIYFNNERDVFVAVYVDDLLIFFKNNTKLNDLKSYLNKTFMMKDVGPIESCLGMRVKQENFGIELDQEAYINDMLVRFGMENSKPVGTPSDTHEKLSTTMVTVETSLVGKVPYQEAVGSLLYLAQCTRPDIAFAVNDVSRFNANHGQTHWKAVKRIFRYLKGTANYKLKFSRSKDLFHCYTDADWASDVDKRRSCSGHVILMSNAAISWQSKRQATVALSSTEAEYMAMSAAICEVIWTQQLSSELDATPERGTRVLCDNESAEKLALSDAYRPRTKHIDIRYHHMRQKIQDGVIQIDHVSSAKNVADALTKAVTKDKNIFCTRGMGLC